MSKVEELKEKYPKVSSSTFNRFVDADKTTTKKYLDFMLNAWEGRKTSVYHRTVSTIIEYVDKFDKLLPYIQNKDIYSKEYYTDFRKFKEIVILAEETKDEKTFKREEHANVLLENDTYLMLQPITHRGSTKYGAGTKWCTTAKHDPSTYERYSRNGFLVYLIDKTNTTNALGKKIALYHEYSNGGLNDRITVFNTSDNSVSESNLSAYGWKDSDLFQVFTTYRHFFIKIKERKKSKDFTEAFIRTLEKLDFVKFEEHLNKLEEGINVSYISRAGNEVKKFLETLNQVQNGYNRQTEN